MNNLQTGQWVTSYRKGIFRIEEIITRYYDESNRSILLGNHQIGDAFDDRIIVSKQLLNSKFKKTLGYDNCSELFVKPLTNEQTEALEIVLAQNPNYLQALDQYQIPTRIQIHNSDLQINTKEELEKATQLIAFIKTKKTFLEIETEMERLKIMHLKPKNFGNYHFQLFNSDDLQINKRWIWNDAKLTFKGEKL